MIVLVTVMTDRDGEMGRAGIVAAVGVVATRASLDLLINVDGLGRKLETVMRSGVVIIRR